MADRFFNGFNTVSMATYLIKDKELLIRFNGIPEASIRDDMKALSFRWDPSQKVWHAPYSREREDLARNLSNNQAVVSTVEPSPKEESNAAPIDTVIDSYLHSESQREQERLGEEIIRDILTRLDVYAQILRRYRDEEQLLTSQKKVKEAAIKEELSELVSRKKRIEERRKCLESVLTNYMLSTGETLLSGESYNLSFKESPTFVLSTEKEEEIRHKAEVPEWITLEIKLNQKVLKEMERIPEGVLTRTIYKLVTWTNDEDNPSVPSYKASLNAFREGLSIDEIRIKRGLAWSTIKGHLLKSIEEGLLDIHAYVPERIMKELDSLRGHGLDWKVSDYLRAINYKLSYDWVSLALSYLKIWSLDDNNSTSA